MMECQYKFHIKHHSEFPQTGGDGREISEWKVVMDVTGGYRIIAHIPDNLADPKAFAIMIADSLNTLKE